MKNLWLVVAIVILALIPIAFGILAIASRMGGSQVISISNLQARDNVGQMLGKQVEITGVVVGDYREEDQLGGFFLQQTDPDESSGSKGIFVQSRALDAIAIGDQLRVVGVVAEVDGTLQIQPLENQESVEIEKLGHLGSITPVDVGPLSKPIPWKALQGMLVRIPGDMIVTDTYDLSRYGQITLSAGGRPYIPTNYIDPNDQQPAGTNHQGSQNESQIDSAAGDLQQRLITLDDGSALQNPAHLLLQPQTDVGVTSLRLGTKVQDLTGIMTSVKGRYRFLPVLDQTMEYAPRPPRPNLGQANLTIASFNVLNYFTSIDNGKNGARGADSVEELDRQRKKLTAALVELDADIIGLIELENNLDSEQDLVQSINDQLGDDIYVGVGIPDRFQAAPGGKNPIRVGMIYRRDRVEPSGSVSTIIDQAFSNARAPVMQEFRWIGGETKFKVIVNHFKSKGADGASGADQDQQDGQSAFNASRRNQAAALVSYATKMRQSNEPQHILVIGDLNAYSQEDPIDLLRESGLVDLLQQHAGVEQPYSYVYQGQAGCLDHALATPELATMVTSAKVWHINADEPRFLDYNVEYNPPNLFRPDPFRSSDHDPILIGLRLPQN